MLKNLFENRRYLLGSFWTDLRYRYAGTALGVFWFIIDPLIEVFIYAVVFTQIVTIRSGGGQNISYTLFLTSGLFPFIAFSQMITRGSNAITRNALYMRRSLIPSEVFVFKEAMVSVFTLLILLLFLVPISLVAHHPLSLHVLLMPLFAVLLMLLGFGMALPLANLRVLLPDLGEIIPVILHLWRWTLPIAFSDKNFPPTLRQLMSLNPPYYFIHSFRDVLIDHTLPSRTAWVIMAFWIVFFFLVGHLISQRLRNEVKDLL